MESQLVLVVAVSLGVRIGTYGIHVELIRTNIEKASFGYDLIFEICTSNGLGTLA